MPQRFGRGGGSYNPLHGKPGSTPSRQMSYGENYGSGPMGLPIRRVQSEGRPMGYQIQFQDEWMDLNDFNDPVFQESFFEPWRRSQLPPGWDTRPGGGFAGRRAGPPVGSRTSRRGNYDPAMIEALLGGG